MNRSKRTVLTAAVDLIELVSRDEEQDLRDQPDQIEHSHSGQVFRDNVVNLRAAAIMIRRVIDRGINQEGQSRENGK